MKKRLSILPMKALAAFCLAVGVTPVSLISGALFFPEAPLTGAALLAVSWLYGVCCCLLPEKRRIIPLFAGFCGLTAWLVMGSGPEKAAKMTALIPCAFLFAALPPAWSRPVWEEWRLEEWLVGLGLQLIALAVTGRAEFAAVQKPQTGCLALFLLLFLFYLNRNGIKDGTRENKKAPAHLRYANGGMVLLLFAMGAAIASWNALTQGVERCLSAVGNAVKRLVALLLSLFPAPGGGGQGTQGSPGGMMGFLEAAGEPSPFLLWMERILFLIAWAAIGVLCFFAIKALVRGIKRLLHTVWEGIKRYVGAAGEAYTDEAESTLNFEEKTRELQTRFRTAIRKNEKQLPWSALDARNQARRLYAAYLKSRPKARGRTAREALTQEETLEPGLRNDLIELYEQARYSDHDIQPGQTEEARKALKKQFRDIP